MPGTEMSEATQLHIWGKPNRGMKGKLFKGELASEVFFFKLLRTLKRVMTTLSWISRNMAGVMEFRVVRSN
jgi:hypothetical protein